MLCFLTARKLKPGSFADFRKAWEPEDWNPRFVRAYHVRSLADENEVISFGLFEGTQADYEEMRATGAANEDDRQVRMAAFVDQTLVDGVYEVIDEVTPAR